MRQEAHGHAKLLFDYWLVSVGISIELCTNYRDRNRWDVKTITVLVGAPHLKHSLLDLRLLLGFERLQSGLRLFTDSIEPEEQAFDGISRLRQINYDDDARVNKISTSERSFEQISEVATTSKLVNVSLHALIIIQLQAGFELERGSLLHLLFDLSLVEELVDE